MKKDTKYWMVAGIYKLTCSNNGKVYIGKSVNIGRRINNHKHCKSHDKGKCYFQYAMLKHGWDSFTIEVLETIENFDKLKDNDALLEREAYYIELYDSTNRDKGYNRCKYSADTTGYVRTEEHKAKLRQPRSPETKERIRQSVLGRKCSPETRETLRQINLGKKRSDETKEKMKNNFLGRTHSEETKEKIRQAKLGKKLTQEHIEKVRNSKIGTKHSEETKEKIKQTKLKNKNDSANIICEN